MSNIGTNVIAFSAEGAIGIPRQIVATPHVGMLGPMINGQNQLLVNTGRPPPVLTGYIRKPTFQSVFPYAHLRIFPTPTI
tara:strand:- start:255 stop:494 length:240 start_codon:yes stop_codon:yes gene_type:complete